MKNEFKNIHSVLKTATGALLGASGLVAPAMASDTMAGWEADVAVLVYSETDRVSAFEPAISLKKTYDDESVLGLKLVYDSLTGASHNGAMASNTPQTFTRPSGNSNYDAAAGETPLDDTFHDSRVSISANYEQPINRLNKMIYGVNVSNEYDFFSVGGSATYMQDINERNTTLTAGVSFEYNTIKPVGGFAEPMSEMQTSGVDQNKTSGTDTRVMTELLLGVTQIIDRNTLMQFNYGYAMSNGYHNDPYKILSVLDGNDLTAGTTLPGTYVYENRPDSRAKHSLFSKVKHFLSGDVVDLSYRYMWDDWKVASHTLDFHYRHNMNDGFYVEPHVRYYSQDAAEFYYTSLNSAEALPEFATADYRLGGMTATTLGIKVGFLTPDGNESSVRLEYYQQAADTNPKDVNGVETQLGIDAVILQYNYRF